MLAAAETEAGGSGSGYGGASASASHGRVDAPPRLPQPDPSFADYALLMEMRITITRVTSIKVCVRLPCSMCTEWWGALDIGAANGGLWRPHVANTDRVDAH